jgi:hypothetical protein
LEETGDGGGCDEKAWAGNGLVSEDHAADQAARAGDAAIRRRSCKAPVRNSADSL